MEAGRVWLEKSHTRGNTERFFRQKDELRREVSRAREVSRTITQETYRQIEGNVESVEQQSCPGGLKTWAGWKCVATWACNLRVGRQS